VKQTKTSVEEGHDVQLTENMGDRSDAKETNAPDGSKEAAVDLKRNHHRKKSY
jgi:hypothetical protein